MSIPIVVCCAGKVAAPVAGLSDCEAALARGSMGNILRIQTYDFIDLYSVSVIALKCAISCYMGLRYNINLVISFMNVMPVLWHVPVCVWHAELVGYVVREKIDRVKTAPHCNWLNALSTTSYLVVARIANINYKTMHPSHHSETEWVDCQSITDIHHNHTCIIHTRNVPRSEPASSR